MKIHPRLEIIFRQANEKPARTIRITMGALIPLTEEELLSQWKHLTSNTLLENAELHVRIMPAQQQCMICFFVYRPQRGESICPQCKCVGAKILSGEEFYLETD